MKIGIFADTHFENDMTKNNGVLKGAIRFMVDELDARGVSAAIFGGDAFDTKKLVHVGAMNMAFDSFRYFSLKNITLDAIPGNHDTYEVKNHKFAMKPMLTIMNLYMKPGTTWIGDKSFLFVPFGFDVETEIEKVRSAGGDVHVVICHADKIRGASYAAKTCDEGFAPEKYPDILFIAGHFHKRQEFKNVLIPGSLIHRNYGDNNSNGKGFYILDLKTMTTEFVEIPSPEYKVLIARDEDEYIKAKAIKENDDYNHYRIVMKFDKIADVDGADIKYDIDRGIVDIDLKMENDVQKNINEYIDAAAPGSLDKSLLKNYSGDYLKSI